MGGRGRSGRRAGERDWVREAGVDGLDLHLLDPSQGRTRQLYRCDRRFRRFVIKISSAPKIRGRNHSVTRFATLPH